MWTMIGVLLFSALGYTPELPPELVGITALSDNEETMVDAVRKFDLQQRGLAEVEMTEASRHKDRK